MKFTSRHRHPGSLAVALVLVHACVTMLIRGYIVPTLTPERHWQYGLWETSDSMYFLLESQALADVLYQVGWSALSTDVGSHLGHIKIFGALLYLSGSDAPYIIFALNGVLLALGGVLLYSLLRVLDATPSVAWALAFAITILPTNLFNHSELLREPLIVPAILAFVLGMALLTRERTASAPPGPTVGALAMTAAAYFVATWLRPYLMLVFMAGLLAVAATYATVILWRRQGAMAAPTFAAFAALLSISVAHAKIGAAEVVAYGEGDRRAHSEEDARTTTADWQAALKQRRSEIAAARAKGIREGTEAEWQREDFLFGVGCSVGWSGTAWLPQSLDAKLEALSCVRQSFQRYCDETVLGARADEGCDMADLNSAAESIRHVPGTMAYAVLTPLPSLWFGSAERTGTGLRRFSMRIEAVLAYVLLLGCASLIAGRDKHVPLPLLIGLLVMLTAYALAVPTPHVFMRMRVGFYLPLLAVCGLLGSNLVRAFRQRSPRVAAATFRRNRPLY